MVCATTASSRTLQQNAIGRVIIREPQWISGKEWAHVVQIVWQYRRMGLTLAPRSCQTPRRGWCHLRLGWDVTAEWWRGVILASSAERKMVTMATSLTKHGLISSI